MNIQGVNVELKIDRKIYSLGFNSASGKTYLYKMFEAYVEVPSNKDKVLLITWEKNMTTEGIKSKITQFSGRLIILDRFDLYFDMKIVEALKTKDIPVLLDLKDYELMNEFECYLAEIVLERDKIMVKAL